MGVIWLRAICGDILYKISTSKLIKQGYLQRPMVELYKVTEPNMQGHSWGSKLTDDCIYNNPIRNGMIAKITKRELDSGSNVLIISNRLSQVEYLSEILYEMNINHWAITGKNTSRERRSEQHTSEIQSHSYIVCRLLL